MEKLKQKERFADTLRRIFLEADTSGDGLISKDELKDSLRNPTVQACMQMLELQIYEVSALFNILDDGDGQVSFEEFLGGAMRLKGNARAIDSICIMHEQNKIKLSMEVIVEGLSQLYAELGT